MHNRFLRRAEGPRATEAAVLAPYIPTLDPATLSWEVKFDIRDVVAANGAVIGTWPNSSGIAGRDLTTTFSSKPIMRSGVSPLVTPTGLPTADYNTLRT